MRIDQRNAGASVTPNNSFTLDRWLFTNTQTSKVNIQQSSVAPSGFSNSLLVTSTSAYSVSAGDTFLITQIIEGFNIADLAWGSADAKPITISFWVRSSITGTTGGALINSADNRNYVFSYTINLADTWEYKTVTIAGDTSGTWLTGNNRGISVRFGLGSGSTFSGAVGAWSSSNYVQPTGSVSVVGTSGATFYITGVQLEAGSVATPFEHRQYGQELALCRRYYAGGDGYMTLHPQTADGTGGALRSQVYFDTPMRAAPTITLISSVNIDGTQAITTNKVGFYADGKANNVYVYSNDGFTRSAEL